MADTDVLIVGAGPVGLTAAAELRRQGVDCRIIDRLPARLPYAKAVGIQPRTLEVWDRMGTVRAALEAAVPLRGQLMYLDGAPQGRIDLRLPPEVPYGFAALPQYETERILEEHLARFGTAVERGTELVSFTQDADGVVCRIMTAEGEEQELRSRFLVGCDGAHSTVRKSLGLAFEGGALPEEYMLADVEVDWGLPQGYGVRSVHHGVDGAVDDVLVCIPLPGRHRYRMSMLVPPELSAEAAAQQDGIGHGLEAGRTPGIEHIQAVLDRLSPEPTTASAMRWSSVFRISHRLVDRYGDGRVFVAGDAAHIHPPTGAQGMNTGIQDAYNLAWKLALALDGSAHPRLLASYDAERRPVGEEVVGRTVRHAAQGVEADPDEPSTVMLREAQLLVAYPDSPIVGPGAAGADGPGPGERAPDCGGLTSAVAAVPLRLYDLLRERGHVLVLYADSPAAVASCGELVAGVRRSTGTAPMPAFVVLAGPADSDTATETDADTDTGTGVDTGADAGAEAESDVRYGATDADGAPLPVFVDSRGEFALRYRTEGSAAFVVRPDGHLGTRLSPLSVPERTTVLVDHLARVFRI
ncbi:FAD-dependent monooxygenase [Streptomyces sp. NPDC046866]|uniref:FAD-dependent monooxygenase n=1 Tax=Streptomyces sp. NPDC046866 TaxID=3154921 RepID=UPI0034514FBB